MLITLGVTAAIAGLGFSFFLARSITRPITTAVDAVGRISQGDMSRDLPEKLRARTDEIGRLAASMQRMTESLRAMLRDVTGGVQTLASSSTEMSAIANQMSGGAQGTSSKSATVATAAEEIQRDTSTSVWTVSRLLSSGGSGTGQRRV